MLEPSPDHSFNVFRPPQSGAKFLQNGKEGFSLPELLAFFRNGLLNSWAHLENIKGEDRLDRFPETLRNTVQFIDDHLLSLAHADGGDTSKRLSSVRSAIEKQIREILTLSFAGVGDKSRTDASRELDRYLAQGVREVGQMIDSIRAISAKVGDAVQLDELQRQAGTLVITFRRSDPTSSLQSMISKMVGRISASELKIEGMFPTLLSEYPAVVADSLRFFVTTGITIGRVRIERCSMSSHASESVGWPPYDNMVTMLGTTLARMAFDPHEVQERLSIAFSFIEHRGLPLLRSYISDRIHQPESLCDGSTRTAPESVEYRFGIYQLKSLCGKLADSTHAGHECREEIQTTKIWLASLLSSKNKDVARDAYHTLGLPLFRA